MNIKKLHDNLCRKAFKIKPYKAKVHFRKLKELLACVDYWVHPGKAKPKGVKIKVLKKLKFSNALVAQCLIHEISHVVSRQQNHNDKFYEVFFKAAESKFGRKFF